MSHRKEWRTLDSAQEYTIGWIAALEHELAAAVAMLDERHNMPKAFPNATGDRSAYFWGSIGQHNVVMTAMAAGEYGTSSAAVTATRLATSLPQIRVGLLVGIGAGITNNGNILLGDVVVSNPDGTNGGVVQYDMYKSKSEGIERKGFLNAPPSAFRTALTALRTENRIYGSKVPEYMNVFRENPNLAADYVYPGSDQDPIRAANEKLMLRVSPKIHYGTIASGNVLLKDTQARDDILARLRKENVNPICFEMEAADENKNDLWQTYAAGTAAAFAKEFLGYVTPADVEETKAICDVLDKVANVVQETNQTTARLESKFDDRQLFDWLSPKDNSVKYNEALQKRYPGTGSWFLDNSSFKEWEATPGSSIWLYGDSGRGKTILSTSVIEHLQQKIDRNSTGGSALLYFYFEFNNASTSTVDAMARSLIWQAISQNESAVKHIRSLFAQYDDGKRQPMTNDLLETLHCILEMDFKTAIILDALDECSTRESLIAWLENIIARRIDQVHLITTSRPDHQFRVFFEKLEKPHQRVPLLEYAVDEDIKSYVEARIQSGGFVRWKNRAGVQKEIVSELTKKTKGMFRLASCQLDELEHCLDYSSLKATLSSLPGTLNEMYSLMLTRIPKKNKAKATRILQFLAYTDISLRVEQVVDIIAVSLGPSSGLDKSNRMPDAEEVALICLGLTTAFRIKSTFKNAQYLQLSHASVKDYLLNGEIEASFRDDLDESIARSVIAQVSLSYFMSCDLAILTAQDKVKAREIFPFVTRAAKLWMPNYFQTKAKTTELCSLATSLYANNEYFFCWLVFSKPDERDPIMEVGGWANDLSAFIKSPDNYTNYIPRSITDSREELNRLDPLYHASVFGLTDCVQAILEGDNQSQYCPDTLLLPLRAAISQGHKSIVELLIANGALDSEKTIEVAFATAVDPLDLPTIDMLISNGADITKAHEPLRIAAACGDLQIVKFLLSKGVAVNMPHRSRYIPYSALATASYQGFSDIVELLISKGADVNVQGGIKGEPLTSAIAGGDISIVELLISKGADVNAQTDWIKHQSIRQMSSKDIDIQQWRFSRFYPCNPLTAASCHGHIHIVELLILHGAKPNACTNSLNCALITASLHRRYHIVRMVLLYGLHVGLEPLSKNVALLQAATSWNTQLITMLLSNGAEVDARDGDGNTALLLVVSKSSFLHAPEILISSNADVNAQNALGQSAMSLAIARNHIDIVKLLYSKCAKMDWGSVPLRLALCCVLSKGYDDIFSWLVSNGAPVNAQDEAGNSLLHLAVLNFRTRVATMLISSGADMNAKDASGNTPLHLAVSNFCTRIATMLISSGADINAKDASGNTPLHLAMSLATDRKLHIVDEMGKMLILVGARTDARNLQGKTILDIAAENRHTDVWKDLVMLRRNNIDLNEPVETTTSKDAPRIDTRLALAAREGHEEAVKMLVSQGATALDAALEAAASGSTQGHRQCVLFLFTKGARALDTALAIAEKEVAGAVLTSHAPNVARDQIISFLRFKRDQYRKESSSRAQKRKHGT